jgi:alpha-1,2-glucosyltransferase
MDVGQHTVTHPKSSQSFTGAQVALICAIILAFTFTILLSLKSETADEGFHTPQIWGFYNGNFEVAKELTMAPVYHAVIAGLMKATGFFSIPLARFITLVLSALSLPAMYYLCQRMKSNNADLRTLIFLTCPIILPFFSLVYTDLPALTLTIATVLFTVKRRYSVAALIGLAAIATRQTNLIWVAFCGVLVILDHVNRFGYRKWIRYFWRLFFRLLPYGITTAVSLIYFYFNGGVAVGDSHQHQISINFSNLYFLLLLCFLFFLPVNLSYADKVVSEVKHNQYLWGILALTFILYMATYSNSHQYNSFGLSFYLRNVILHYTVTLPLLKAVAFIPIAWMALTLMVLFKESNNKWLLGTLYLFICGSVMPLPLIEQRYYLPALTLLIAFMPNFRAQHGMQTLALYIPINCVLLHMIANHKLFL